MVKSVCNRLPFQLKMTLYPFLFYQNNETIVVAGSRSGTRVKTKLIFFFWWGGVKYTNATKRDAPSWLDAPDRQVEEPR